MLKKFLIRCWRTVLCVVLLIIILDIGLHLVSHTEWFRARVTQTLQNALGRDIKLAQIGANLHGISIDHFAIAEQDGFENGTFVEAGRLHVRVSLLHLLHGHAKINLILLSDTTIRTHVLPDGRQSWQDLLSADADSAPAPQETSAAFPLRITATHIRLENTHLFYTDATGPHALHIEGLNIGVNRFSFTKPFSFYVQAKVNPTVNGEMLPIPFVLRGTADLKNMDLSQAAVDIHALSAAYKKASVLIKGRVENFTNPQFNLQAELRRFSDEKLAPLVRLPAFELDKAEVALTGTADLDKSALTIHLLSVNAPGLKITGKGGLLYANPNALTYDISANGKMVLEEIGRWFRALAEPYRLLGTANAQLQATHKQVSGTLQLTNTGVFFPQSGQISDLNATLNLEETTDFKTGKAHTELAGKVNGHPFTASLQAMQRPDELNLDLHVKAEEISLPDPPAAEAEEPAATPDPATQTLSEASWALPPITLKADLSVDKLRIPYFYGTDVVFKADMQGLTPDLKQAHGSLQLSTGNGKILDLYKLTNANPLTKVLFLSLTITGKVFNTLNVFDVLGSIGGGIASVVTGDNKPGEETQVYTQTVLGPDGQPMEVTVAPTHQQVDGQLAYDKFATSVNFVKGLATVKKGTFVSSMMSFRLDGMTDFNTQQVDLTVHAAPGKHEVDGMLPLTLTIDGTIDNPQGNMALVGSVASLVTQSVTHNVISRQVGKGVKGIANLFKKKPAEEEPAETQPIPTDSAQTTEQPPAD